MNKRSFDDDEDTAFTPEGSPGKPRKLKPSQWWDADEEGREQRKSLADWLCEFCARNSLVDDTLEACLSFIDRVMTSGKSKTDWNNVMLTMMACLIIASKREQREEAQLDMDACVYALEDAFTKAALVEREREVLSWLEWTLCMPDRGKILEHFVACFDDDIVKRDSPEFQLVLSAARKSMSRDKRYFLFSSAQLSAAYHFFIAWISLGNEWNVRFERAFGYDKATIKSIAH